VTVNEVRADPPELARASQVYLDTSQDLFATLRTLRNDAPLATGDLGTVEQAEALVRAQDRILGHAGTLLERLIAVMEIDADNLLRVAFAYQRADELAAQRMHHPTIPTRGPF
jgi:hypothetical protein